MSVWLSQSSLMAPVPPPWLDTLCQRLGDNDPSLVTVELANMHRIDDVFSKVFVRSLEQNHTCSTLILSFASIVDDGAYAIASVLARNKHIQRLQLRDLRNNREINILLTNILKNTTITELSFRHCQICPRSAQAIQAYLGSNPNVQELRLVDCQLVQNQDLCMEVLCRGIQHSRSLRHLYMLNMELDPPCAMHLAAVLAHPDCRLEELHLGENNLADPGVGLLAGGVLRSSTLRLLDLRSNSITEQGALLLQGIVARSAHLQALCLSHNEIGPQGAAALARGLQQSKSALRRLLLSENGIGNGGCQSLAYMLRFNNTLQELDLSMNDIGNEGASAMAFVLTKNKTLRTLNLRRNAITDMGAVVFAQLLVDMLGLKELIMNKNAISKVGGTALLQALQSNTEIEYLTVTEDTLADRKMVHWFHLNRAGRRIFKHHNVPCCLWPKIYGKVSDNSDCLFFFVKARPETVPANGEGILFTTTISEYN